MKDLFILGIILGVWGCTPMVKKNSNSTIQIEAPLEGNNYQMMDKRHQALLDKGRELIGKGDQRGAIVHFFNPVLHDYEKLYHGKPQRIYNARTQEEYDFYSLTATNEGKNAHILSDNWSRAYFLKGYALLELKEVSLAEKNLRKALYLSPSNSQYLSELGRIQHLRKEWKSALKSYRLAEKSATLFSPESVKKEELLRAKRGMGYSYIELRELPLAEAIYQEILKIDSRDKIAIRELRYIRSLKK